MLILVGCIGDAPVAIGHLVVVDQELAARLADNPSLFIGVSLDLEVRLETELLHRVIAVNDAHVPRVHHGDFTAQPHLLRIHHLISAILAVSYYCAYLGAVRELLPASHRVVPEVARCAETNQVLPVRLRSVGLRVG